LCTYAGHCNKEIPTAVASATGVRSVAPNLACTFGGRRTRKVTGVARRRHFRKRARRSPVRSRCLDDIGFEWKRRRGPQRAARRIGSGPRRDATDTLRPPVTTPDNARRPLLAEIARWEAVEAAERILERGGERGR
jgi:hypothetical protein